MTTIRLLRADPTATLHPTARPGPVRVTRTYTDLPEAAATMADYKPAHPARRQGQDHLVGTITIIATEACGAACPGTWISEIAIASPI